MMAMSLPTEIHFSTTKKDMPLILMFRYIIHHPLNNGDITLVFFPGSPLRSTKEGKLGYVHGRDGSQLPQSIPAFSKHFRKPVASRIDVVLQDVSVLGNFRTVYRDVIRHWPS